MEKSSLIGWKGGPSHKRVRVHNIFKNEHLLLERKEYWNEKEALIKGGYYVKVVVSERKKVVW